MNAVAAKNLSVGDLVKNINVDSPATYNRIVMAHEIVGNKVHMVLSHATTHKKIKVCVDKHKEYIILG